MTEKQAKELLTKYLSGEASPAEASHVEQWFKGLETGMPGPSPGQKEEIGKQMFLNLQRAMIKEPPERRVAGQRWFRAAVAILIAGTVFGAYQLLQPANLKSTKATQLSKVAAPDTLRLADGSQVELGAQSSIDYATNTKKFRRVRLSKGEAFFNVKHDSRRPFIVEAGSGLSIRVLGTSFSVRNQAGDGPAQVEVSTGKVAVSRNGRLLGILTRGQQLSYDYKTAKASVTQLQQVRSIQISFSASSLADVISELGYAYNIRITLADEQLSHLRCTASFNSAQSLEDILDILCRLHHIRFKPGPDPASFQIYR
ncbi:FecR family protein [Pedobacter sp. SYP-B3415]|uniref:FecR family protein n=1 Tax=Pedobacter sp. SYP-B3415 TaxID=2496641 RepID=UPI00101BEA59|nr:FecR domain-containing protein [Pedobacter sp. SYP-B3415]